MKVSQGTSGLGLYAPDGSIRVTESDGSLGAIYAPDGSYRVSVSDGTVGGIFAPDGSLRVTVTDQEDHPAYAADGSLNVYVVTGTLGEFTPLAMFSGGKVGAYYDPSVLSSMFQDSSGTVPVTAADDPVGMIQDLSGNGWHLIQTTDENRPILRNVGDLWYLEATFGMFRTGTTIQTPHYICWVGTSTSSNLRLLGISGGTTNTVGLRTTGSTNQVQNRLRVGSGTNYDASLSATDVNTISVFDTYASASGSLDLREKITRVDTTTHGWTPGVTGITGSFGFQVQNFYGGLILLGDPGTRRDDCCVWFGAKGGLSL